MRLIWGGCESREAAYLDGAERLGARERLALETHARTCVECADALRNARPVDVALRGAFAPLRERRTIIAPGRVRLAVGPRTAAPEPWLRVPQLFGRLTEGAVMVAAALFVVGASLQSATPSVPAPVTHSVIEDYYRSRPPVGDVDYLRWLRLVKTDDSSTAPIPLSVGDSVDGEAVDILQGPGGSPR